MNEKLRNVAFQLLGPISAKSINAPAGTDSDVYIPKDISDDDLMKLHVAQQTYRLRSIDRKLTFFVVLAVIGIAVGVISAFM